MVTDGLHQKPDGPVSPAIPAMKEQVEEKPRAQPKMTFYPQIRASVMCCNLELL